VAGLFDRYDRWITRRLRAFRGEAVPQRALAAVRRPVVLVSPRIDPALSPASELYPWTRGPAWCRHRPL